MQLPQIELLAGERRGCRNPTPIEQVDNLVQVVDVQGALNV